MKNDLAIARVHRSKATRRAARDAWLAKVNFRAEVSWPPGLLGAFIGALLLLTPPLFIAIGVWLTNRVLPRKPEDRDPGGAA